MKGASDMQWIKESRKAGNPACPECDTEMDYDGDVLHKDSSGFEEYRSEYKCPECETCKTFNDLNIDLGEYEVTICEECEAVIEHDDNMDLEDGEMTGPTFGCRTCAEELRRERQRQFLINRYGTDKPDSTHDYFQKGGED